MDPKDGLLNWAVIIYAVEAMPGGALVQANSQAMPKLTAEHSETDVLLAVNAMEVVPAFGSSSCFGKSRRTEVQSVLTLAVRARQ